MEGATRRGKPSAEAAPVFALAAHPFPVLAQGPAQPPGQPAYLYGDGSPSQPVFCYAAADPSRQLIVVAPQASPFHQQLRRPAAAPVEPPVLAASSAAASSSDLEGGLVAGDDPAVPLADLPAYDVDAPAPAIDVQSKPHAPLHRVFFAFLQRSASRRPATSWRAILKRVIAVRSGGERNHVELVFQFADYRALACTVLQEEGVRFKERSAECRYIHPYWEVFEIDATPEQRLLLYEFCVAQNGKRFNSAGLYCNFAPCCLPLCCGTADPPAELYIYQQTWFCSQLCTAALQYADRARFGGVSPARTHVEGLYRLLHERKARNTLYLTSLYNPSSLRFEL